MPREDFDHIPGWEGDVKKETNLAREVFFFSHLPKKDDDYDDYDDDNGNDEDDDDDNDFLL